MSLSADGTRVAVGAYTNDGSGSNAGHVRVFQWSGGQWAQLGSDIDGEAANEYFGKSVSLSANGTRVAVGAYGNNNNQGTVRAFEWNGAAWVQLGSDIDGEAAGDRAGSAVSLSADGARIAVGAPKSHAGSSAGHVRVFEWSGGAWVQQGNNIDGEAAGDQSGKSVSLSADGARVAVGAHKNVGAGIDAGHARVYMDPTLALTEEPTASPTTSPTTSDPTAMPTSSPITSTPTATPTSSPTMSDPTASPTTLPSTSSPTGMPIGMPTSDPTTSAPTISEPNPSNVRLATAAPTVPQPPTDQDLAAGSASSDDSMGPAAVAGTVVGVVAVLALITLVAFLRAGRKKDPTTSGRSRTASHAAIRHSSRRSSTSAGNVAPPDPGRASDSLAHKAEPAVPCEVPHVPSPASCRVEHAGRPRWSCLRRPARCSAVRVMQCVGLLVMQWWGPASCLPGLRDPAGTRPDGVR